MPRYWVIAPVESKPPELFDKVWQFDLVNNLISIGWKQLGDVSKMSRDAPKLKESLYEPAQKEILQLCVWRVSYGNFRSD